MYLTSTLLACLLLGQTAGDGSPRLAPMPALPAVAPSVVLPPPKENLAPGGDRVPSGGTGVPTLPRIPATMPDLPGAAAPRSDLPPADLSPIPKTPGGVEDRGANPSAPQQPHRPTPLQMVASLSTLSQAEVIAGSRLSLVQAVSRARDRNQQAAVIHAYWRLTQAVAEYHICFEAERQLTQFRAKEVPGTILLTAQAAAKASLQAAKVAVSGAQYELAAAAQLSTATLPPLPADFPHAGPYRTSFEGIASRSSTPPAALLLNRTLPDNYQAIQQRLTALHEADNARTAAIELYQTGQVDLPALLRCHDAFVSQQRIFMADVCDYNHRIADYVLSVVQRPMTGQALVDMLILTEHSLRVPGATPGKSARSGALPGSLGLDAAPNAVRAASAQEPLSRGSATPPRETKSILRRAGDDRVLAAAPANQPASTAAIPSILAAPTGPLSRLPPSASLPTPRTAEMQITRSTDPKGMELFSGLVEKSVANRAQELCTALHAPLQAGQASQTGVKPVELRECLRMARPADRREVIAAYWLARQRAAESQWLAYEKAWLDQLDQPARDRRATSPAGPLETVRLRAAREAVDANRLESSIALLEAEFDLTRRCGAAAGSPWLMPVTAPHAGPYDLKQASLSPQLSQSWAVRRLVDVVPGYLDDVQHRASAAVQADVARAASAAAYQDGGATVETLLGQIERETTEVRSFLQAVTKYNQSIAEYVLLVVSPSIDADTLSRALVIPRS